MGWGRPWSLCTDFVDPTACAVSTRGSMITEETTRRLRISFQMLWPRGNTHRFCSLPSTHHTALLTARSLGRRRQRGELGVQEAKPPPSPPPASQNPGQPERSHGLFSVYGELPSEPIVRAGPEDAGILKQVEESSLSSPPSPPPPSSSSSLIFIQCFLCARHVLKFVVPCLISSCRRPSEEVTVTNSLLTATSAEAQEN